MPVNPRDKTMDGTDNRIGRKPTNPLRPLPGRVPVARRVVIKLNVALFRLNDWETISVIFFSTHRTIGPSASRG